MAKLALQLGKVFRLNRSTVFTSPMSLVSSLTTLLNSVGMSPESRIRTGVNRIVAERRAVRHAREIRPRRSFSQFGEDSIVQSLVPEEPGFYVDVGSGHPISGSNTYALYEKGWTGILVDPIASNIKLSEAVRPRDKAVTALIGSKPGGACEFYEFETYQYSTMVRQRAIEVEKLGHQIKARYMLETLSMNEILPEDIPCGPLFWSIDVEGVELQILDGNPWNRFRPDLICIEEWNSPLRGDTEISQYLIGKGYELVAVSGFSAIYGLAIQRDPIQPL